jgi:proton-coupled amino acid transporter
MLLILIPQLNERDSTLGDTTRNIYKWKESREPGRNRHNSEPDLSVYQEPDPNVPSASELREPGMFRRFFLSRKAQQEGKSPPPFITRNFIDFLVLYGTYGGDVVPSDDEEEYDQFDEEEATERTPLVRNRSVRGLPTPSVSGTSESKAFFMLVKAFVGTGVLFLPRGFANGGIVVSSVLMIVLGYLTLHCMILLVNTSRAIGGKSYGDIGQKIYGPKVRIIILASIAVSQMGFCCAYYIFVAQNLRDWLMIVSDCQWVLPDWVFIIIQTVIYIPLAWVRRIKNFGVTSLVADVFILMGLLYIFVFDLQHIGTYGPQQVAWFNLESFSLFVGTAMFSFKAFV